MTKQQRKQQRMDLSSALPKWHLLLLATQMVHEQPARSRMVNTLVAAIKICSLMRKLVYIMNDIRWNSRSEQWWSSHQVQPEQVQPVHRQEDCRRQRFGWPSWSMSGLVALMHDRTIIWVCRSCRVKFISVNICLCCSARVNSSFSIFLAIILWIFI